MIGYVTLGTNNLEKAAAFYDALYASIGGKRVFDMDGFISWGESMSQPALSITKPYNKEPATVGNGVMVALIAKDPAAVDAIYAKAIELGATDEGKPGARGQGFYAGYFRDLDGNKLNAFCWTKA